MTKVISVVLLLLLTVVMVAVLADYITTFLSDIITATDNVSIIEVIKGILP